MWCLSCLTVVLLDLAYFHNSCVLKPLYFNAAGVLKSNKNFVTVNNRYGRRPNYTNYWPWPDLALFLDSRVPGLESRQLRLAACIV